MVKTMPVMSIPAQLHSMPKNPARHEKHNSRYPASVLKSAQWKSTSWAAMTNGFLRALLSSAGLVFYLCKI
jgi:hypothetical protein